MRKTWRQSLEDLEFKNFEEITEFDAKLGDFLGSLDEELVHWRGYEKVNGKIRVNYPMIGYACMDNGKIIAISYYVTPRIMGPRWLYDLIFRPRGYESGVVVKKEYHRRGIASHLNQLKMGLLRERGVKQFWYRIDLDNDPSLRFAENLGRNVWK
ncbi:GNAT family N-acetyltransferase, partial [Candidatus Bathyarchaeota archaeon]|nr:GNAT family N-acetyltransferase [Candidatus Bathyarchaeota archaeon]